MRTIRERALQAYEQRELDALAALAEGRQYDCGYASLYAAKVLGITPESSVWDATLGCPVLSFDGGDVRLAWQWDDGKRVFLVVFACEDCGGPITVWPEVRSLADMGSRLNEGLTGECYEGHRCAKGGERRLADYLTAEVA